MKLPKKFCKKCMTITPNRSGFCDTCEAQYRKEKEKWDSRLPSNKRGYDWKWRMFSKDYLKRNPTCVLCGAPATITDHKIPIDVMEEVWGKDFYDESLFQPLCVSCNTKKGLNEDKEIREEWNKKKKELNNM